MNLLSNALRFTKQGGVTVRASCSNETPAILSHEQIHFEVEDTGLGIAAG